MAWVLGILTVVFLMPAVVLLVRSFILSHRFGVYFLRSYPDKAKDWQSRFPTFVVKPYPLRLMAISYCETDMPEDETLKDLRRRALHAWLGSVLLIVLWLLMGFLFAVVFGDSPSP